MSLYRNDLEIHFKCYHHDDKQTLCNWPHGVSVRINGHPVPIDRVSILLADPHMLNKTHALNGYSIQRTTCLVSRCPLYGVVPHTIHSGTPL